MNFNLNDSIQILSQTPGIIGKLLHGLSEDWIDNNEGKDTWSPFDIVGHLIHGEKTDWIPRANIILEHGETLVFEPYDRFAQFELSKGKTISDLLKEFADLRNENIEILKRLSIDNDSYSKTGIHPDLGKVNLKELLATWVVHDLSHINQITRVMAKNYKDEVGPWKAYVSIIGE